MKKILVNKDIWQTRVAVLSNDRLQDIYFDVNTKIDLDRCFFKGKVSKVLPGIDRELATQKITEFIQDNSDETEVTERDIKSSLDIG